MRDPPSIGATSHVMGQAQKWAQRLASAARVAFIMVAGGDDAFSASKLMDGAMTRADRLRGRAHRDLAAAYGIYTMMQRRPLES